MSSSKHTTALKSAGLARLRKLNGCKPSTKLSRSEIRRLVEQLGSTEASLDEILSLPTDDEVPA